jgi:hypothetical protein
MDRAMEVQLEVLRRLSAAERLQVMAEMCDAMRELAAAGMRARQPSWPEDAVQREVRRIYGALAPAALPT